jgi:hypothetical protein
VPHSDINSIGVSFAPRTIHHAICSTKLSSLHAFEAEQNAVSLAAPLHDLIIVHVVLGTRAQRFPSHNLENQENGRRYTAIGRGKFHGVCTELLPARHIVRLVSQAPVGRKATRHRMSLNIAPNTQIR